MKKVIRGVVALCMVASGVVWADPPERSFCSVPYWQTGFPMWVPLGCSYIAPDDVFLIVDGLPPGTTIEADPVLYDLSCLSNPCEVPGGTLGGKMADFGARLQLHLSGTGDLAGFSRVVEVEVISEVHAAPFVVFDGYSNISIDYYEMIGAIAGDPDFDWLQIVAGTGYGYPGPGSIAIQPRPGAAKSVDSTIDLGYRIDFVGAPGGELDGLSGSTQGTVRLVVERPPAPAGNCEGSDRGDGTAELPPSGCQYMNRGERMNIIDGLPPGSTIVFDIVQSDFECEFMPCGQSAGLLGEETESFESQLILDLRGTGALVGYQRTLTLTADQVDESGPRSPGDPIQHFPTAISTFSASLAGDPDFDSLTLSAGDLGGLSSPGKTTITDVGAGTYLVDSFFDISYQIDFVGAPGGVLEGLSGTTLGTVGVIAGIPDVFSDGFESGYVWEWSTVE